MSFDKLGLNEPILKALKQKGYKEPSCFRALRIGSYKPSLSKDI